MATLDSPESSLSALLRRHGVRQFLKFCIVGASSTVIDLVIFGVCMEVFHLPQRLGSAALGYVVAKCISAAFSITNGFIWNNRWTFADRKGGSTRERYGKFVLTNVVGMALSLWILVTVAHALPPDVGRYLPVHLHNPAGLIGNLVAICVVVFWNFTASRLWTFKH